MPEERSKPVIDIDFSHGNILLTNVTDETLHVESTELQAERSGKKWSKTYAEGKNSRGFDLLPDTKKGAEIRTSRAIVREVAEKVANSTINSEQIKVTVRVTIKGKAAPEQSAFCVKFANGQLAALVTPSQNSN